MEEYELWAIWQRIKRRKRDPRPEKPQKSPPRKGRRKKNLAPRNYPRECTKPRCGLLALEEAVLTLWQRLQEQWEGWTLSPQIPICRPKRICPETSRCLPLARSSPMAWVAAWMFSLERRRRKRKKTG